MTGQKFWMRSFLGLILCAGCVRVLPPEPAPLFTVPLSIDSQPVDDAIVDTGGEYDLILRQTYGLSIAGRTSILAYGGPESVVVTDGFSFNVGGIEATTPAALVGLSVCDCNGVGFEFFRKAATVVAIDFRELEARFLDSVPEGGVPLRFVPAPEALAGFDSSFIDVDVQSKVGTSPTRITALLDTGTNMTILRRGVLNEDAKLAPDLLSVLIDHPSLGTVHVTATLFDTPGLPDLVLGTDVMGAWGERWYFAYDRQGGTTIVIPWLMGSESPGNSLSPAQVATAP